MSEELLSRRGLSLERLQTFLAVAEHGGIARAAAGDPVRQSQFSRQIGELEEFFGVALTQRRGRTLALTDAGRQLAALTRAHFGSLDDFLRHEAGKPVELRIGAGDSLITWILLPCLAPLQRVFPRTNVRLLNLRSSDIVHRVAELRLDFGLARTELVRPPLEHAIIGRVRYRLFLPRRLRALPKKFSAGELLARVPLATLGSDEELFAALNRGASRRAGHVRFALLTESFPQAARAVLAGDYAAILPAHAAPDLPGCPAIDLPLSRELNRSTSLVWNPRFVRTRLDGAAVRDHLRDALRARWNAA